MENMKVFIEKGLDKLPQCKIIREEVFIKEQKFENEFDDIDSYAYHELILINDKPIATARIFQEENGSYHLGRVCVIKEFRGQNLGKALLYNMESYAKMLGAKEMCLSAQTRAKDFYKKCGYIEYGEEFYDEYCPHINMKKSL